MFVLINPNFTPEKRQPPVGLGCVAIALGQAGIPWELWDFNIDPPSPAGLFDRVRQSGATVFGLSVHSWSFAGARLAAKVIRQAKPECSLVLGGPFVSGDPDLALLFIPEADIVVRGDGEPIVARLYHELCKSEPALESLAGLCFREGDSLRRTAGENFAREPGQAPSPYLSGVFDLQHYNRATIALSRGCPFSCIYCSWGSPEQGGAFRRYPTERTLDEVAVLNAAGIDRLVLSDGTANADGRLQGFCRELIRRRLNCQWTDVDMRADLIEDGLLELLVEANCDEVGFGLETVKPATQALLKKRLDPARLPSVVGHARTLGLRVHVSFIIGLPFETEADVRSTMAFAHTIPADVFGIFRLRVQPGTELYCKHDEYGIRLLGFDPERGEFESESDSLDLKAARKLAREAREQFEYVGQRNDPIEARRRLACALE